MISHHFAAPPESGEFALKLKYSNSLEKAQDLALERWSWARVWECLMEGGVVMSSFLLRVSMLAGPPSCSIFGCFLSPQAVELRTSPPALPHPQTGCSRCPRTGSASSGEPVQQEPSFGSRKFWIHHGFFWLGNEADYSFASVEWGQHSASQGLWISKHLPFGQQAVHLPSPGRAGSRAVPAFLPA